MNLTIFFDKIKHIENIKYEILNIKKDFMNMY